MVMRRGRHAGVGGGAVPSTGVGVARSPLARRVLLGVHRGCRARSGLVSAVSRNDHYCICRGRGLGRRRLAVSMGRASAMLDGLEMGGGGSRGSLTANRAMPCRTPCDAARCPPDRELGSEVGGRDITGVGDGDGSTTTGLMGGDGGGEGAEMTGQARRRRRMR